MEGFDRLGLEFPNVTDNSGMMKSFLPNLNISDAISSNVTLTWLAKDFSNHTDQCSTEIFIQGNHPLIIGP